MGVAVVLLLGGLLAVGFGFKTTIVLAAMAGWALVFTGIVGVAVSAIVAASS